MKALVKVNVLTEEITMTKATAQKAGVIGSDEYEQLVKVKRDFPHFRVKITSPKARANSGKGLTMALMEKLIRGMTDDDQAAIERFEAVRDRYKGTNFHFSKPKTYFLSEYSDWREWLPQVEDQPEEPAQAVSVSAVEEQKPKWAFGK